MSIALDSIHKLDIFFDAGENVPPPFHSAYHLELSLKPDQLLVQFDLRYLHREELSEEEILEEGFTLQDDWSWQGALPDLWRKALLEQLRKSIWPNKPKEARPGDATLEIQLLSQPGELLFSGTPADPLMWEYFLQELIQAAYEVAGKEAPLEVHYREILPSKKHIDIWLNASFAQREATAWQEGLEGPKEATIGWAALKKLMKAVYLPEYNYDEATDAQPKQPGRYLETGEGLWFEFGQTLTEPTASTKSLERLEASLKELF
ncbi:hypothetical protein, partial [Cesiribacter andamanensis]|uniref:hypothetical protein n=1 Tax=Cesiribacter andamanensis TaxID=649507 RepID=UPI00058D2642